MSGNSSIAGHALRDPPFAPARKLQAPRLLYMGEKTVTTNARTLARLLARDTRGAAMTEYVVLVGTVGIVLMVALVAAGPVLVHAYQRTRDMIAGPFP